MLRYNVLALWDKSIVESPKGKKGHLPWCQRQTCRSKHVEIVIHCDDVTKVSSCWRTVRRVMFGTNDTRAKWTSLKLHTFFIYKRAYKIYRDKYPIDIWLSPNHIITVVHIIETWYTKEKTEPIILNERHRHHKKKSIWKPVRSIHENLHGKSKDTSIVLFWLVAMLPHPSPMSRFFVNFSFGCTPQNEPS